MFDDLRKEASRRCSQVPSFGEVLDTIRKRRNLTQAQLGEKIHRSAPEANRLLNNHIPQSMTTKIVHEFADCLGCSDVELAELEAAFICYTWYNDGFIDPDEL